MISPIAGPRGAAPADRQHGIKVEGEGERNARKHGGSKRRVWRKIHIGIDEKAETRAVEFTVSGVSDAPMLPELLDQIRPASVTSDSTFDARKATMSSLPVAIMPPRKNVKPWKPGAGARNEALRTSKRLGRTI